MKDINEWLKKYSKFVVETEELDDALCDLASAVKSENTMLLRLAPCHCLFGKVTGRQHKCERCKALEERK